MLHTDLPGVAQGGVAYQVSRLAHILAKRGHTVDIFTFSPPPPGVAYSVRRIRAPHMLTGTRAGRLVATPLAFALRSYQSFDVVHAHGDSYLLLGRRRPIVRTFYGSAKDEARHSDRMFRKIVQHVLHLGELVSMRTVTVTVAISQATCASIGRPDAVIPCGVDIELFRPGPKSSRPTVLFIGTLHGRKRGRLLLDAFRTTIRPQVPDCELWLAGDESVSVGDEGVRTFGRVSDERLARLLREAWVLAHPSVYEGFGVPYIEAMASGTAVITTENAGARELLAATGAGIVASDTAFPAGVVSLLQDYNRRRELEARGRELSGQFAWSVIADRYEEIYELAMLRRRAPRSGAGT